MKITPWRKSLFALIFCIPGSTRAQELLPGLEDFFIGETAFVQDKKEVQVTVKPTYFYKDDPKIYLPLQLEYGLTDRLELGLQLVYSERSWEAGFLYNIVKSNKLFLSAGMDLEIPPRAKNGKAQTTTGWNPKIVAATQMGKVQVQASLAAEINKKGPAYSYNLGAVFPVENWRGVLELNGKTGEEKSVYLIPGVLWKGWANFELGLGLSKSIMKTNTGCNLILMITREFSLVRRKTCGTSSIHNGSCDRQILPARGFTL